jgi:hypothetical protein
MARRGCDSSQTFFASKVRISFGERLGDPQFIAATRRLE